MASLAVGVVGGDMAWPLVVVGVFMGIAMIMMQVRSPMLVAVGMYLPFETTFAIFLGGVFRAIGEAGQAPWLQFRAKGTGRERRSAHRLRLDRGRIAAGAGLGRDLAVHKTAIGRHTADICQSLVSGGARFHGVLAVVMIRVPLASAGDPNEPAPPTA